jgi:translation initiation factor 1
MAKKKPRHDQNDAPGGLTHNPFAALRGSAPKEPVPPTSNPPSAPTRPEPTRPNPADGRPALVVRREKKGRAGKTVTRISGLTLAPAALADLARELKRALGCGATVEGADVLLQGSLTERTASWLRERLGARVTIGN